jgi:hypothetical protein
MSSRPSRPFPEENSTPLRRQRPVPKDYSTPPRRMQPAPKEDSASSPPLRPAPEETQRHRPHWGGARGDSTPSPPLGRCPRRLNVIAPAGRRLRRPRSSLTTAGAPGRPNVAADAPGRPRVIPAIAVLTNTNVMSATPPKTCPTTSESPHTKRPPAATGKAIGCAPPGSHRC